MPLLPASRRDGKEALCQSALQHLRGFKTIKTPSVQRHRSRYSVVLRVTRANSAAVDLYHHTQPPGLYGPERAFCKMGYSWMTKA